jgi:ATP-binding cassette subfamily G (WHITE) protein 2 (PDR)
VLYEGRQIYFGPTTSAKAYFTNLGFECASRETTADFLTSLTSPAERNIRPGFEGRVPYTPDEFEKVWKESQDRARLIQDIAAFEREFPVGGDQLDKFRDSRKAEQANHQYIHKLQTHFPHHD